MKNIIRNIVSISMAVVVLLSTFSFSIQKHYCGKTLVDTAWFVKAKDCGMESTNLVADTGDDIIAMKKSCCKDESHIFSGQDELKNTIDSFEITDNLYYYQFDENLYDIFVFLNTKDPVLFKEYSPPKFTTELYRLYETYLI